MSRVLPIVLLVALSFAAGPLAAAQLAITGARVHTLTAQGTLEDATILIEDGRIVAVGPDVRVPAAAARIEASGREVTPGLFAGLSDIGLVEVGAVDASNDDAVEDVDLGAAFSVARAVNPDSVLYGVARAGGVTHAFTAPADGNDVFAGQGSVIQLDGSPRTLVAPDAAMVVDLGADGARHVGGSRAAALQRLETAFEEAELFASSAALVERGQASNLSLPRADLAALASFVASGRPMAVRVDRATDIRHALSILRARGIAPVIVGGAEAWKLADELAEADVPVLLDPLANIPGGYDRLGARIDNATLLHEAGVRVGIMESGGHDVREIRQYAGNAVAHGLPWEVALAAITRTPAELWRVDDQLGRIAPGMAASLVVWTGDPLELSSWAETVVIDGEVVPQDSRQLRLQERYRNPRSIYGAPD
jgi:imidazolonepropionase-like amidohydrolase